MNLTYSHKNHFDYTVGDKYSVRFGKCSRKPKSFREECVETAKLVAADAQPSGLPLYLYMSGGQDSEVMARSFIEAGIPFTACILVFEDNKNHHDIRSALTFCEQNNVPVRQVDFNIRDFILGPYLDMATKYLCSDVSIMTHVWTMLNIEEHFPVVGGGDIEFTRIRGATSFWIDGLVRFEKTQSLAPMKALTELGRSGATRFFSYTPEIMASYITHPLLQFVMKNEKSFSTWWEREWKSVVYHDQWTDITPRQKYDGFEKVVEAYPARWPYSGRLNPVVDDDMANRVSQALFRTRSSVKTCELTLPQIMKMLQIPE